jgi:hypothetical protein
MRSIAGIEGAEVDAVPDAVVDAIEKLLNRSPTYRNPLLAYTLRAAR